MTAAATVSKSPAATRPAAPVKEAARSIAPADIAPALLRAGLIRAKLKVGAAGDPEEREADRMADGAMAGGGACCAKCAAGQSCDDTIRMKPAGRSTARDGGSHAAALTASLGGGEPMPARLRAMFEPRYGQDLSHIRLHTDETGAASARAIGARAFALGPNIAFGAGEYQPDTRNGQWLIAHEVAHVVRGHEGVRRRDPDLAMSRSQQKQDEKYWQQEVLRAQEARRRHEAWSTSVEGSFRGVLAGQSSTIGAERERVAMGIVSRQAAALDAVSNGAGWLPGALQAAGYAGPAIADVKSKWGSALLAAELIAMDASGVSVSGESRLAALDAFSSFYGALRPLSAAIEAAHARRVESENTRLRESYDRERDAYDRTARMDRMSQGPIGEPGERAARGAIALLRGSPPEPPQYLSAPAAISPTLGNAENDVLAAESVAQWEAAAATARRAGAGFVNLVAASLPSDHDAIVGLNYLEQLDLRLAEFERGNPVAFRIPAVFYPLDKMIEGPGGEARQAPESIPWQFYLIHTGVTSHDRPATAGGEWKLVDLTSGKRFENTMPGASLDAAMVQQGFNVDPPAALFGKLNSSIRFPKGRLYFKMPRGTDYLLETTEPWSLSDWLRAIGLALTVIAVGAAVIATGGAAAPAAVAFYAGIGAGVASIGASFAHLDELNQQGALTGADVDEAAISIGIDLVSMMSMGFGRLLGNAAKLGITGERLLFLQRVTQAARAVSLGGNVYQVMSATSGFVSALQALENQPGLSPDERKRRRGELVRRGLLTGLLMIVAIRGDVKDLRSGRIVNVAHVDEHGVLVARPHGGAQGQATDDLSGPGTHPHADTPSAGQASRNVHAEVAAGVHDQAQSAGTGFRVGPQSHAVGVGGSGTRADFYFCSDRCSSLRGKLEAIVDVLPAGHPEREIFAGLLGKLNGAVKKLRSGKITGAEADGVADAVSDEIRRHGGQSEVFAALMNTDIGDLIAHRAYLRTMFGNRMKSARDQLELQGERQAASRGSARQRGEDGSPADASPLETDLFGGLDMQNVARPGHRPQPLRFDTGNFGHGNAEALVPGLPRGLDKEVHVTFPDGTTGRADRVQFIRDPDGAVVGFRVYEIKPNTADQIAAGHTQAQRYVDALKARIEADLRQAGRPVSSTLADGRPAFGYEVMTYDRNRLRAVLRALRANRSDYGRGVTNAQRAMAEQADEAIARQLFGG